MRPLELTVQPLAFAQTDEQWLPDLRPYVYQQRVYHRVAEALARNQTLCLFIATPTGSGKTLASYAYTILHSEPAFGVYPTNELIRDQERALKDWIDPAGEHRLLRIDRAQLDDWQIKLDLKCHSETLDTLLSWTPTILTNPDILFYIFFGLYGGPEGVRERLIALIGQYRLFIFDEFHLYNVKQIADVAFLVGTLHTLNPCKGRVFLFASATPDSPILPWLRERLHLPVEVIVSEASDAPQARTVAHSVDLAVVPADLTRWEGSKALLENLWIIQEFLDAHPQARLVAILDSVYGAMEVARVLRDHFPDRRVGEVHGFSSEKEREEAIRAPMTVGTSTIEVGIDFRGEAEKDILVFEARTASQFIQRFGRLARHEKRDKIPNRAIACVPDYVYQFLAAKLSPGQSLSRQQLYELIQEAYAQPEDFARYLNTHAPAEFQAACSQLLRLFQPDDEPRVRQGIAGVITALTGKCERLARGLYHRYKDEHILAPLLTFRGSSLEVAILDERGTDSGFPIKRYDMMFLLRRGIFEELDEEEFLDRLEELAQNWPEQVALERRYTSLIGLGPEDLLGVYGYFRLKGLLDKPRKVYFEVDAQEVAGREAQVTVIQGLEVITEPLVPIRRLNRRLRRKRIVAWFIDRHPSSIKLGRALPPLFEIYELHVHLPGGGKRDSWSIVFNQDAFFVESLGWRKGAHADKAFIL